MGYFESIQKNDHEQVIFCSDKDTGLKAIISIHDTTLGPALGGCRMKRYESEEEALRDVLRLSRAMTYKSSLAGLNLGGGKTVVMIDHPEQKTPELLEALARRINFLKGSYIGAGDIGSDTHDLSIMKKVTPWVTGLSKDDGGLGDSAILTSLGVFMGFKAAVHHRLDTDSLSGVKVAVQGVGKVGFMLIDHFLKAGCELWVTDINETALNRAKLNYPAINVVGSDEIFDLDVDVFSPNAIGGIISPKVAKSIKAMVVAGGANNILLNAEAGEILKERNILYAPDFVINSGGVIMVACEIEKLGFDAAQHKTENIYNTALNVFNVADQEHVTTHEAAKRIAIRRVESTKKKHQQRSEFVIEQHSVLC